MDTLIGVDIGTSSAQTGVFTTARVMLASVTNSINLWRDGDFTE